MWRAAVGAREPDDGNTVMHSENALSLKQPKPDDRCVASDLTGQAAAGRSMHLVRSGDLNICWFDGCQTGSVGHTVRPDITGIPVFFVSLFTPLLPIFCALVPISHTHFRQLQFVSAAECLNTLHNISGQI